MTFKKNIETSSPASKPLYQILFAPISAKQICDELAISRACYADGMFEDFDDAIDEISKKYDL